MHRVLELNGTKPVQNSSTFIGNPAGYSLLGPKDLSEFRFTVLVIAIAAVGLKKEISYRKKGFSSVTISFDGLNKHTIVAKSTV